jgi:MerR family copper efflux transcriptional regulator
MPAMNVHVRVLAIGQLARAAGVTTPTIRYYEEIGLLPPARRSASGQRSYDSGDIERLTFIRRCRDFGFSIDEVRDLAGLSISAEQDCTAVRDMARARLNEVRARLAELRALETSLNVFAERCDTACAGGPGRDCAVFETIRTGDACC